MNEQVNAALDEELANAVRSLDPATPTPRPVRGVVLHTRAGGNDPRAAPADQAAQTMNVRWPLVPADSVPNRFGWRHEGPGPQWPETVDPSEELLPASRFDHPALKRRPLYVPQRVGVKTFSFMMRKGCAGLAHCYRREPEALYRRITELTLKEDDGVALRWMIAGLHHGEDFVGMHTMSRLTIQELAHLVRSAFTEKETPYRSWLNQWGREPDRPLPSLPGVIPLESEDDLTGLHIDDIPVGDDRRIDHDGITYLKLHGHRYWLERV